MSDPILQKKVQVLFKLRNYKIIDKEEMKDGEVYTVESSKKKTYLVWSIDNVATIGIRYINQLAKNIVSKEVDGGIIVTRGRYTYAAKANSKKKKIELIPSNFPAFYIFDHKLVPKHEILSEEEKKEILEKYRVKPYQFPLIKTSDPIAKAIGARAGEIVRVIRESPTAGEYVSFRYVVDG